MNTNDAPIKPSETKATKTPKATRKKPVLSRHPKAKAARQAARLARQGGEGVGLSAPAAHTIDPLPSQNPPQKDFSSNLSLCEILADESLSPSYVSNRLKTQGMGTGSDSTPLPAPSFTPEPDTDKPPHSWGDGSFRAAIYARPVNPRILMIVYENGVHGRLVISPKEKVKFSVGGEVWVKVAGGKDLCVLSGVYNRFGRRVR
jgi:predicted DNA-binding antitoxin AbrB/MazE fold protein